MLSSKAVQQPFQLFFLFFYNFIGWYTFFFSSNIRGQFPILASALVSIISFPKNNMVFTKISDFTQYTDIAIFCFYHSYLLFFKQLPQERSGELIDSLSQFYSRITILPGDAFSLINLVFPYYIQSQLEDFDAISERFLLIVDMLFYSFAKFPDSISSQYIEKILQFIQKPLEQGIIISAKIFSHSIPVIPIDSFKPFINSLISCITNTIHSSGTPQYPLPQYQMDGFPKLELNLDFSKVLVDQSCFCKPVSFYIDENFDLTDRVSFPEFHGVSLFDSTNISFVLNSFGNALSHAKTSGRFFLIQFSQFISQNLTDEFILDYYSAFLRLYDLIFLSAPDDQIKGNELSDREIPPNFFFNQVIFHPSLTVFKPNSDFNFINPCTLR